MQKIAAEKWLSENESYKFTRLEIKNKSRRLNNKQGRPMKDEEVQTSYLIDAEIKPNQEKIQEKELS